MHIIGIMVFLWAFGPAVEDALGHERFLVFSLAGGIIAMMAQILGDPHSLVSCLGGQRCDRINYGAVARVQTGGVAYLTHIGRFVFGVIAVRLFENPHRIACHAW